MANNIVQLQDKDGNNIFPISGGSESMPVGTEVSYDGETVPAGWQEVDDPSVYSTTEQIVGTWIDGKPIYRQAFNGTNISTGASVKYVELIASDVDTIVNYGGSMHFPLVKIAIPSGGFPDNSAIRLAEVNGALRLQADLGTAWTEYSVWAEYTKTTD